MTTPTTLEDAHVVSVRLDLTPLQARVLFHLLNESLSLEQLQHILPHPNEREAARQVYQRVRALAYGGKEIGIKRT